MAIGQSSYSFCTLHFSTKLHKIKGLGNLDIVLNIISLLLLIYFLKKVSKHLSHTHIINKSQINFTICSIQISCLIMDKYFFIEKKNIKFKILEESIP